MDKIKNLKVELAGQIGENAVWDGPLSKEGFPMGKDTHAIVNLVFQLLRELKHTNK